MSDEPVTHHLGPEPPRLTPEDIRAMREMLRKTPTAFRVRILDKDGNEVKTRLPGVVIVEAPEPDK